MPDDESPFGYYEARVWIPEGQGVWPAVWGMTESRLLPPALRPPTVEIDIMENHGRDLPGIYSSSVYNWSWSGGTLQGHHRAFVQHNVGEELAAGWHTYGVEITPEEISFNFDGVDYWSVDTPADLNSEMIWMLNLAAGGGWPVDPALDVFMYVDYFRIYERLLEIDGTAGADTLRGTVAHEHIEGFGGNDKLYGGDGNDAMRGGDGADRLAGEAGNDRLFGGRHQDTLFGGLGADMFVFAPGDGGTIAPDAIQDFRRSDGDRIDLSAFDDLEFIGSAPFSRLPGQLGSILTRLRRRA